MTNPFLATFTVFFMLLSANYASADELETQVRALNLIKETASEICSTIEHEGKQNSTELSGNVKGQLGSAVGKLVDLGVDAAGKYSLSEYKNVLQSDLATAIQKNSDCRLEVLRLLEQKLLPTAGARSGSVEKHKYKKFIISFGKSTTFERIREIYGSPDKDIEIKNGYSMQIYRGDDHRFIVIKKAGRNTGKFAILRDSDASPDIDLSFSENAFSINLARLTSSEFECYVTPNREHLRHSVFITNLCYFGRPGRYQYY